MDRGRSSSSSSRSRSSETTSSGSTTRGAGIEVSAAAAVVGGGEEKVFVAVGKQVKGSKSTLLWALQNFAGLGKKKITILHVHQPIETISILGGRFRINSLRQKEVEYHRTKEKREVAKVVDEYLSICTKTGVEAEKAYIETASVEKGIVALINQLGIRRLVMGAASDGKYSRKMTQPKSTKAIYVNQHAPPSCRIWFVCKGRLIYTRESNTRTDSISRDGFIDIAFAESSSSSRSLLSGSSSFSTPGSPSVSEDHHSSSSTATNFDEIDRSAMSNPVSCGGGSSRCSVGSEASDSRLRVVEDNGQEEIGAAVNDIDKLSEQLKQATLTAESSNQQAVEESLRRQDAEKKALEAIRKMLRAQAEVTESMYLEEQNRREELEQRLARSEEEVRHLRREREEMLDRLLDLTDENSVMKRRLERSEAFMKDMKERIVSATDSLRGTFGK